MEVFMKGIFNKILIAVTLMSVAPGVKAMGPVTTINLGTVIQKPLDIYDHIGNGLRFVRYNPKTTLIVLGLGYCAYVGAQHIAYTAYGKTRAFFGWNTKSTQTEGVQANDVRDPITPRSNLSNHELSEDESSDSDDDGYLDSKSHVQAPIKSTSRQSAHISMLEQLRARNQK